MKKKGKNILESTQQVTINFTQESKDENTSDSNDINTKEVINIIEMDTRKEIYEKILNRIME